MRFKGITTELVDNGERTDKDVLKVSICMILISLVFIAVVLSLVTMEKGTSSEYSVNSPVGWVAVVGAAVVDESRRFCTAHQRLHVLRVLRNESRKKSPLTKKR